MEKVLLDRISEICEAYSDRWFYPRELISKKMWTNMFVEFRIPHDIEIIALIDTTLLKSGKRGLIIADTGLYLRNSWPTNYHYVFFNWEQFKELEFESSGSFNLSMGDEILFNMSGISEKREDVIDLFYDIQECLLNPIQPEIQDVEVLDVLHLGDENNTEALDEQSEVAIIDVNIASQEELLVHLGLGIEPTKQIIQHREMMGGFKMIEEVGQLLALKSHQIEVLRGKTTFSPIVSTVKTRIIDY
jgi:hypothetical protein